MQAMLWDRYGLRINLAAALPLLSARRSRLGCSVILSEAKNLYDCLQLCPLVREILRQTAPQNDRHITPTAALPLLSARRSRPTCEFGSSPLASTPYRAARPPPIQLGAAQLSGGSAAHRLWP